MKKYRVYLPGVGYLIGDFNTRESAEQTAKALDRNTFKTEKAYQTAKETKALHQVREVTEDGQKTG